MGLHKVSWKSTKVSKFFTDSSKFHQPAHWSSRCTLRLSKTKHSDSTRKLCISTLEHVSFSQSITYSYAAHLMRIPVISSKYMRLLLLGQNLSSTKHKIHCIISPWNPLAAYDTWGNNSQGSCWRRADHHKSSKRALGEDVYLYRKVQIFPLSKSSIAMDCPSLAARNGRWCSASFCIKHFHSQWSERGYEKNMITGIYFSACKLAKILLQAEMQIFYMSVKL